MDCNTCKDSRPPVPYLVHENSMSRMETANKRLFWALIVSLVFLACSWAGFIWYESQWEVVETSEVTQDIDSGDGDVVVSGIGDIIYGTGQTKDIDN